jgi:hypothetical protein
MIASDRCYQLSLALYSMATQIAYEDVQTASTQLTQCATNVLTVNRFFYRDKKILYDQFRLSMDHYNKEPLYLI